MIIIFHIVANILVKLVTHFVTKRNTKAHGFSVFNSDIVHPLAQRDAENDIKFDPPVFKQRYERVTEILLHEKWKNSIMKVVDFGSAELGLFVFLKNTICAKEIVLVDIDEYLLQDHLFRIFPLNADHLRNRPTPLNVKVFAGSVTDPDPSLQNTDAVIAVELIEHLYPDSLDALPYNIFSHIQPKVVVVTTPNADFNVLFPKLKKFRHLDHKFEWTREQFQSWAKNISLRFPSYTVQFEGIGLGPHGTDHLGCCSQIAVFIRKDICDTTIEQISNFSPEPKTFGDDCLPKTSYGVCTYNSLSKKSPEHVPESYYKLLASIDYPHYVDPRTEEEKLVDELKYRIHIFEDRDELYNYEKNRVEIPLNCVIYKRTTALASEEEVRNLLLKLNYRIEECFNKDTERFESCVICEPDMESGGSGSDTEASDYGSDSEKYNIEDAHYSDWDDKDSWTDPTTAAHTRDLKSQLRSEANKSKKPEDEPPVLPMPKSANHEKPTKLSNILSVFNNFDKINELDAVCKEKKFFNFPSNLPNKEVMKKICQEIVKHPVAGPSRDPKRTKMKKTHSSDSDDSVSDVKCITTCILENSLNKIDLPDDKHRSELIQELLPEVVAPAQDPEAPLDEPVLIVENGDLANNNRDLEGNNYPAEDADNPHDLPLNNANNNHAVVEMEEARAVQEAVVEDVEIGPAVNVEVAWSSREALFDVNSHVDLLEDFEMDPAIAVNAIVFPSNYVIVPENNPAGNDAVHLPEEHAFPNWLLQIFEEGEVMVPEDDLHDEPHFYCQGDGLGVHPSVVAINDDDDDDDDEGNESGSDSSSSGSVEFASAENQSAQEVFAASQDGRTNNLVVVGQPLNVVDQSVEVDASDQEDVFENAEGSESNLAAGACDNNV